MSRVILLERASGCKWGSYSFGLCITAIRVFLVDIGLQDGADVAGRRGITLFCFGNYLCLKGVGDIYDDGNTFTGVFAWHGGLLVCNTTDAARCQGDCS